MAHGQDVHQYQRLAEDYRALDAEVRTELDNQEPAPGLIPRIGEYGRYSACGDIGMC